MAISRPNFVTPDLALLAFGVALAMIGLVAISSASIEHSSFNFGQPWHHAIRHGVYLAIGITLGTIAYMVPTQFWQSTSQWWLLVAIALLLIVLVPGIGRNVNGSQRWIPFGPVTIQPSELAKFALVIYTAGYLVRHGEAVTYCWRALLRPVLVLGVVAALLLLEPDFGATVIATGTVFGMLFLGGARLLYVLGLVGVALAGLAALVIFAPYRLQRLTAYTDPWADPFGSGFQLIQSLIAYGRGEWIGVGLGNSIQKLFYLPEAHTDFVFSIWAEETGLVGSIAVIALFVLLVGRILQVGVNAQKAKHVFSAYVCYGIALIYSGQAFVNMGVSSGLLPTKGLTLPFISYGGSSLILSCVMLAIVLRIAQLDTSAAKGKREPRSARGARR